MKICLYLPTLTLLKSKIPLLLEFKFMNQGKVSKSCNKRMFTSPVLTKFAMILVVLEYIMMAEAITTIRTGSSVAEQLTADQRVTGSIPVQSFFLFFFKPLT